MGLFPPPPPWPHVTWQANWTWIWSTNARLFMNFLLLNAAFVIKIFWIQIYEMIHILFFSWHVRKFHVFHKKAILVGHVIDQGRKIYNKVRWNCYTLGEKLQQMSRRHVAVTNRLMFTREFMWKFLSLQQNFVAATSLTNAVWFDFFATCCSDNILWAETKKFLQYTPSDLSLRRVAATACCDNYRQRRSNLGVI